MREKELLLVQLEQAFQKKSWHGTNLTGSIRGLKLKTAAFRPGKDRNNIWELIVHCAYWKYSVFRRLEELPAGSFPLKGSNFFRRPEEKTEKALKADIKLLKNCHKDLLDAVARFSQRRFDDVPKGSKTTYRDLIVGVGAHDLYHAGQIQLIKRLAG
ncbi:MAG: DinB family protein [Pyrinomonadaceae bacterium]|nr:DinB family protein [Pyrinomonadaceae bacterium]